MSSFHDDPEVDELFRAVLDQNLTETQVRSLETILLSSPKVREDYLRLTEIDHFLHRCYHGDEVTAAVHPQKANGQGNRAFLFAWAAACVVAACAVGLFLSGRPVIKAVRVTAPEVKTVAVLTRSVDAVWVQDSGNPPVADGPEWKAGQWIELEQGIALVTFTNGVECVITGKAKLRVTDELNCFLAEGIGTFDVPENATGFTVHTLGGAFEDLGTSFGVAVSGEGNSVAHVLKGSVNARAGKAKSGKQLSLFVGQAAKVNAASETLSATAFRPETFSRPLAFLAGVESLPSNFSFWSQPMTSVVPRSELQRPESLWLSKEKSNVVLTQELLVKSTYGNTDTPLEQQDIRLPAGTRLSSYLLHFSHATVPSKPRELSGAIRFNSPVVALVRSPDELTQTDSIFCFEQTNRSIEGSISKLRGSDESEDYLQIVASDHRELRFRLSTAGSPSLDQVRILVVEEQR